LVGPGANHLFDDGDLGIRECGARRPFTYRVSSFRNFIPGIVLIGPKEEVLRVDARGVVTPVEDAEPSWDCRVVEFPGEAVGFELAIVDADLPVAITVDASCPEPTTF
jgi:hypothetical protein